MKAGILVIKFEQEWISQNEDRYSVIDDVLRAIRPHYNDGMLVVVDKDENQCRVVVAGDKLLDESEVIGLVKSDVLDEGEEVKCDVSLEDADSEKLKSVLEPIRDELLGRYIRILKEEFAVDFPPNKVAAVKEEMHKESQNKDKEEAELIGIEPIKAWANELEVISKRFKDFTLDSEVINNQTFILSINKGNGLTTVLKLMTRALEQSGLMRFRGTKEFVEWKLEYNDSPNEFPSFEGLLKAINRCEDGENYRGLVCINMEEWLDHLSDKRIDQLLRFVWGFRNQIIFVFTIPYAEDSVIEKLYDRIDDIISVRTMKFVPPSDEQYFVFFKGFFEKYNISVSDNVKAAFISKMTEEKNDGKFYGFNTVNKIANELLYNAIVNAAKNDTEISKEITAEDFAKLYGIEETQDISGVEQLNGMVALEDVKNKVREILSMVKLQKELYAKGNSEIKPCFHMMFLGNPGTGKTVVARIIGRIFKEEGLLEIGNFFEVSRKDFIGKFVGHTAPKTMEICRNAYGSVLFIDEAYTLADERDGYSKEAIGTLIAEMENNRDKMVVIFAGYEKELEELFDMNPGLRDRIPHKINFPNYNREELKQIFFMHLKNKISCDESFEKEADVFFRDFPEEIMQERDFSNGRFVRNLAERIISKAAMRFEMSGTAIEEFALTANDFSVAVADNDFSKLFKKVKHVKTIGF
ncbi:MAG: AAA family ATPase [Clostridia bacterium]|nr:AAA family ATPase [Clostridia bacterium]